MKKIITNKKGERVMIKTGIIFGITIVLITLGLISSQTTTTTSFSGGSTSSFSGSSAITSTSSSSGIPTYSDSGYSTGGSFSGGTTAYSFSGSSGIYGASSNPQFTNPSFFQDQILSLLKFTGRTSIRPIALRGRIL